MDEAFQTERSFLASELIFYRKPKIFIKSYQKKTTPNGGQFQWLQQMNSEYNETCKQCQDQIAETSKLSADSINLQNEIQRYECLLSESTEERCELEQKYAQQKLNPAINSEGEILTPYGPVLAALNLPPSFFEVILNSDYAMAFLLRSNLTAQTKTCKCGQEMPIIKQPSNFVYACTCGANREILEGRFWRHTNLSVDKVLLCIFLWTNNVPAKDVSKLTGISDEQVKTLYKSLRRVIAHDFLSNFSKFSGIVEIDESCFRRFGKSHDKWVFGLYERATKRVYMEIVQTRTAKTLLPLIMSVCEPGTTIISDQWAAYNRLADLGFPHYTVDHSRFFVHPENREIHTQHIEISWGWAKYYVLRNGRTKKNLQEKLYEFCWKKQFKQTAKLMEMAEIVKNLMRVVQRYQDVDLDAYKK